MASDDGLAGWATVFADLNVCPRTELAPARLKPLSTGLAIPEATDRAPR